jgi:hypothetical protein
MISWVQREARLFAVDEVVDKRRTQVRRLGKMSVRESNVGTIGETVKQVTSFSGYS